MRLACSAKSPARSGPFWVWARLPEGWFRVGGPAPSSTARLRSRVNPDALAAAAQRPARWAASLSSARTVLVWAGGVQDARRRNTPAWRCLTNAFGPLDSGVGNPYSQRRASEDDRQQVLRHPVPSCRKGLTCIVMRDHLSLGVSLVSSVA
jgi:hypothetical protein